MMCNVSLSCIVCRISDSSSEAFILMLYRESNKVSVCIIDRAIEQFFIP